MPTKQAFRYITFLILLGSCVYAICYYLHILDAAQLLNIGIVFIATIIAISTIVKNRYFANSIPLLLIFFCIGSMLISGLIQNSLMEIIPTATRYLLYLLIGNICYFVVRDKGIEIYDDIIRKVTNIAIILTILFVGVEILLNDIDYLNGAYRIAGSFKKHQLGEALFVYVLLILYWFLNKNSLKKWVTSIVLFAIIISTQSRALIGIIFVVGGLYNILKIKSFFKLVLSIALLVPVCTIAYYAIMYTDFLPRFKYMFASDSGVYDASTLERIEIMENSLSNINGIHKYIGVGIGGFQRFYQAITGREAVAAHNNYLLFYIEGGYLSLVTYILFQLSMLISLFRNIKIMTSPIVSITFFLFMGITLLSFLLNNYYFYCSETIVWSAIGAYLGYCKKHSIRKSYE